MQPWISRRAALALFAAAAGLSRAPASRAGETDRTIRRKEGTVELMNGAGWLKTAEGRPLLRYLFGALPEGERGPSVPGTSYAHPLYAPDGDVITDVAPPDHPHHRGVFCAWVEVAGVARGDWWGWGAKAPKEGCVIAAQSVSGTTLDPDPDVPALLARNHWNAGATTVLKEDLVIKARRSDGMNVSDYVYSYSAPTDQPVTIAENPFGGFCYRARPRGTQRVSGPDGLIELPDSVHNRKERNWPASPWYDLSYTTPEGKTNGCAVLSHPDNPLSTWHVVRNIHMLNPCVVSGGPLTIQPGKPLVLKYRLAAHDGAVDAARLNRLYAELAKRK